MGGAEEGGDGRRVVGAHDPVRAAMANARFGEAVEVAREVYPFEREAVRRRCPIERFLDKRQFDRATNVVVRATMTPVDCRSSSCFPGCERWLPVILTNQD